MSDKSGKVTNQRSNMRHLISVPIRLVKEDGEEVEVVSGNVSDCGLYVEVTTGDYPRLGSVVQVQVMTPLGDGSEAPINNARVVRHDSRGVGLKFLFDNEE